MSTYLKKSRISHYFINGFFFVMFCFFSFGVEIPIQAQNIQKNYSEKDNRGKLNSISTE